MWIKGWDINVKGKQFHILFVDFIVISTIMLRSTKSGHTRIIWILNLIQ
jgi:hypothetical protein